MSFLSIFRRPKPTASLDQLIEVVDELIERHDVAVLSADRSLTRMTDALDQMERQMGTEAHEHHD